MTLIEIIDKFKDLRVTIVGDPILDHYVIGEATRISPEAPVPVVKVEKEFFAAGGAANVAVNVARLGASSFLVAPISPDLHGTRLLGLLESAGVYTSSMVPPPMGGRTIVKTRILARSQQVCRVDIEGSPESYSMDTMLKAGEVADLLEGMNACILSDYGKGAVTEVLASRILEVCERRGTFTALDPKPGSGRICLGFSLLTPNRDEASQMADNIRCDWDDPEEDLARIFSLIQGNTACENLAVTLGPGGIAVGRSGVFQGIIPAEEREVFDVSGAGDTVISVMTLAMAAGASLEAAATLANLAAGCVIRRVGTSPVSATELIDEVRDSEWRGHDFDC